MADLLDSTGFDPWRRTLAAWLVTTGWMVAFYLALWAVFFTVTAYQATWGGPYWLPGLSGLATVVLCSAVGLAAGRWLPTWYAAPLAATGTLTAILGWRATAPTDHSLGPGLLSPIYPTFGLDASVFYPPQPDLALLKITLYTGLTALLLSAIMLATRRGHPFRARLPRAVLCAGVVLVIAAGGLDATARNTPAGIVTPALHSGQTLTPVAYDPVCTSDPLPLCVHPAYGGGNEPAVLGAIVNQVVAPVLGVPGMPVVARQWSEPGIGVTGSPPTLWFQAFIIHDGRLQPARYADVFRSLVALTLFTSPGREPVSGRAPTPVQRALALSVIQQAHLTPDPSLLTPDDPAIAAAARRFTAMSRGDRVAWLDTHLSQVRQGLLTPGDIP
jgi:hypothetical protein